MHFLIHQVRLTYQMVAIAIAIAAAGAFISRNLNLP